MWGQGKYTHIQEAGEDNKDTIITITETTAVDSDLTDGATLTKTI